MVKAKTKSTSICFLLDESASMEAQKAGAISGFNEYISTLNLEKKDTFTFTKFNTEEILVHDSVKLEDVKKLTAKNYVPSGMTALYDAIGKTVTAAEKKKADRYLMVILTDGKENSSKEYNLTAIQKLLRQKEIEGNWTFVYLSSHADSWKVGQSLGIPLGNIARVHQTDYKATFNAMSVANAAYLSGTEEKTKGFVKMSAEAFTRAGARLSDKI